ncbi:MAG: prolyl oligopeptidase family serine peptidase [Planctomycetota bacterium]
MERLLRRIQTSPINFRWILSFAVLMVFAPAVYGPTAYAQGTKEDYERSKNYYRRHQDKVYRIRFEPNWIGDAQDKFSYRIQTASGAYEYVFVDAKSRTREFAFDHELLAKQLAELSGKSVRSKTMSLNLSFADSLESVRFRFAGSDYEFDRGEQKLSKVDQSISRAGAEGLTPQSLIARSRDNGSRTPIRFDNRLDETLSIYWVTRDGNYQSYGEVAGGKNETLSTYSGHAWLLRNRSGEPIASFVASEDVEQAVIDEKTPKPKRSFRNRYRGRGRSNLVSPDDKWRVSFEFSNVRLTNIQDESTRLLTDTGTDRDSYGGRVWWAPDSSAFVVMQTKQEDQREVRIVDSSPDDSVHPRLISFSYTKPGDELDQPRPVLFAAKNDWEPQVIENERFSNPFAIRELDWHQDSKSFSFLYNQRGHQVYRLIRVDAQTATPSVIIDESPETFVCYSQKSFLKRLDDTNEAIWMSERSGWNHLYLIDTETGSIKNPITSGEWVVREVERVDTDARQIWLSVSGIEPGQDPYYLHLIRINFDGTDLVRLTEGDGTHRWRFSPDNRYLIDSYSRVDMPAVTILRDANTGEQLVELERGNMDALLETGWQPPERFVAKGRDGETDIYGVIVRPTHFDPDKTYPVLEAIYAGPHSAFVPKSFGLQGSLYEMAELGFIVVKIDGMGTSHRSKAFHDVCWKNLGDSGFPDRIAWIKAASEDRPEMDLSRVGIWGGSAGGQSAMRALIAHGDFYHAAVADCGCHDNRVDKIWWNEQWMGWPIGPHYAEQSNVTQAHKVQGDLMLIWGELDRNVDPASTMQVIDALVKANVDFEQLVMPGQGHGAAGHPYAKRRQADFFIRKLWNREPRSE